jgi:glycine dehydrogenase
MLRVLAVDDLDALINEVIPSGLRIKRELQLPLPLTETTALARLKGIMSQNDTGRAFIGCGYYDCVVPPVIQRTILENPGWYTAYTPYQAEISQGRLEALLNFQTLICELTALPVANASLLDEATAAAEAMALAAAARPAARRFYVSDRCFAQTIAVLQTRAEPLGIDLEIGDPDHWDLAGSGQDCIGILLQVPGEDGSIDDAESLVATCHTVGGLAVVACDLLSLTLLRPPGEWGADLVVGSAQRFGVPLGYGGPHAAFMSCADALKRRLPGRLIGVSRDADGRPALRLSLQTREQHIRREKATSNICTAQVLLAVMAGFYAVSHGPEGLKGIAGRIAGTTDALAAALRGAGYEVVNKTWFDTLTVALTPKQREDVLSRCRKLGIYLREDKANTLACSLDEAAIETGEWRLLFEAFALPLPVESASSGIPVEARRKGDFLPQGVFHRHHTETELLRYIRFLEGKDIALNWSMIALGSCTMKLNAAAEMMPLSWPSVGGLHPFLPASATSGYQEMITQLESWLAEITGFAAVSVQPNAGSQGEFAGLLAIRRFHESQGNAHRTICLIPVSAHGTNPASAVMAGMKVVPVSCDADGNIDLNDMRSKAAEHASRLGAVMVTYPSTHGVFEEGIREICQMVHAHGGQVYLDGANLNALVGLCTPGDLGADVCHLNLHKTFCIPHGGGGPGVGPIGVASHLVPFLPGHPQWSASPTHPVSAAPWGSASILTISWMYLAMMGPSVRRASELAILNANYLASRLADYFPVLYRGKLGRVAHECILDLRPIRERTGIDVEDIAKRLIDYGFHSPTMSWPVPGTLMIEPTESESLEELERFIEAMVGIHGEIEAIASGLADPEDNALKGAPHPAETLLSDSWSRAYTREQAAFPLPWLRQHKYWPPVSRIDNVAGDRNLVCTCEGMDAYASTSPEAISSSADRVSAGS